MSHKEKDAESFRDRRCVLLSSAHKSMKEGKTRPKNRYKNKISKKFYVKTPPYYQSYDNKAVFLSYFSAI